MTVVTAFSTDTDALSSLSAKETQEKPKKMLGTA
jgi:hypothetical protein